MAEKQNNMNINISDETAKGTYSNIAVITHSPAEFVIDFAQAMPGNKDAVVRQRIIMPPIHAKRLLMALSGNVVKYEEQFGTIEEPHPSDTVPFDFTPQGKS